MDFQDILYLLVFLVVTFLSKKNKNSPSEDATEDQTDIVRKKIEALRRKRNGSVLNVLHKDTESKETNFFPESKLNRFSAYDHLPKYEPPIYETQAIVNKPLVEKIKKSNLKSPPSALREGMKWHIILSKPVCTRSFYGNFTSR